MKTWRVAPILMMIGACASTQPKAVATVDPVKSAAPVVQAPKPFDPTGSWEYSTVVNGETVTGNFVITGTPGAYTGKATSSMLPEFPITSVTVADKTVTMKGMTDNGEVAIVLTMNGDAFTGKWALGESGGDINGKKLPKQ